MQALQNLWFALDGRKTYLGLFLGVLYYGALHMGLVAQNSTVEDAITALVGVGLAHKVAKRG